MLDFSHSFSAGLAATVIDLVTTVDDFVDTFLADDSMGSLNFLLEYSDSFDLASCFISGVFCFDVFLEI